MFSIHSTEIQELKRNLVSEVRRNHALERELTKLDKRIALLIKNRGNIQEILAHTDSKKKDKNKVADTKGDFTSDARKLEVSFVLLIGGVFQIPIHLAAKSCLFVILINLVSSIFYPLLLLALSKFVLSAANRTQVSRQSCIFDGR